MASEVQTQLSPVALEEAIRILVSDEGVKWAPYDANGALHNHAVRVLVRCGFCEARSNAKAFDRQHQHEILFTCRVKVTGDWANDSDVQLSFLRWLAPCNTTDADLRVHIETFIEWQLTELGRGAARDHSNGTHPGQIPEHIELYADGGRSPCLDIDCWEPVRPRPSVIVVQNGTAAKAVPIETDGQNTEPAVGNTPFDIAMFAADDIEKDAKELVRAWRNRKVFDKLASLGKDPQHGNRRLYKRAELLKKYEKVVQLDPRDKSRLIDYLRRAERAPQQE